MSKSSAFFFYTFHQSFTDAENLALVLELERLCDEIKNLPFAGELSKEIVAIKAMTKVFPRNIQPVKLQNVLQKLRSLGVITEMFLGALVAVEYDPDYSLKSQDDLPLFERIRIYKQYKPLVVLLSFRILEEMGFMPEVPRAVDEIRRVIAGYKREKYILPDLRQVTELSTLFCDIRFHEDKHESRYGGIYSFVKLPNELNTNSINYCDKVLNFNTVQKKTDKEKIQKQKAQQAIVKSGGVKALVTRKDINYDFGADINADPQIAQDQVEIVKITGKRSRPNTISRYQAEAISKRISSTKRRLPSDLKQATKRDIQVLLNVVFKQIKNETKYASAAKLLLLSLLLGKRFDDFQFANFHVSHKRCAIEYELNAQKYGEVDNYQKTYKLHLPDSLTSIVQQITFSVLAEKANTQSLISDINKKYQTKLSLAKISRYIYTHLLSLGRDKTIISLITGPNKRHQVSLNYVTLDASAINAQFQCYVDDLKKLCHDDCNLLTIPDSRDDKPCIIGSKAYLLEEELVSVMRGLKEKILAQDDRKNRFTPEFHNLYSLYTYLILVFASGYRPVIDVLGYRRNYQITLGLVHVIDKEKGKKNEGRLIYLGHTAKQQLLHYLDYCQYRRQYYKITQPQLSGYYHNVLSDKRPLFFFLGNQGEYREPRPSTLHAIFADFGLSVMRHEEAASHPENHYKGGKGILAFNEVPIPLNWHRHYVRSLLLKHSLANSSQLITEAQANAWMGHDDRDSDIPLAQFSHMSTMDLKHVATVLDAYLQAIDVNPMGVR